MMGVHVIERPAQRDGGLAASARCSARRRQAGIGMPEVGIFDAPETNAFATGCAPQRALVAVSTGLLQSMRKTRPRRCSATRSVTSPTATW